MKDFIHFHSGLNKRDKILILTRTLEKVVRGSLRGLFFHKNQGLQFIGRHVQITHSWRIHCGRNVKFEDYSEIHGLAEYGLIFGNNVTIGRETMIRPSSYYGKDLGKGLKMGDGSSIGPHSYVGCAGQIDIGENVMIGPKCSLFAENHIFRDLTKSIKSQGVQQKGIKICDNCWIGSNVIILDGVTIGSGSVIGAGTIITHSIPENSIVLDKRNEEVRTRL
ncbi:DapH/DapD/GlmU-related protein [Lacticaseibacillus sp. 866-1]|uniref:acyltransferase n=1 Tax=Lacticaseibacillus sp. 866-1 TaxID=2799576 RepID=UPI001EF373D8|nr:acyltransferase [Lacticaseibacillus sp. 866-1]